MASPQTTDKGTSLIQQYQKGEKEAKNFQLDILEPVFSKRETQILLSLYKRKKKRKTIARELDQHKAHVGRWIREMKEQGLIIDSEKTPARQGKYLELSNKGRKLVKKIIQLHRDMGYDQEETQQ